MTPAQKTVALFQVGTARNDHATVEAMLRRVVEGYDPPAPGTVPSPVAGAPDMHYRSLRLAKSKLDLLSDDGLAAVAGPEAREHLEAFHEAFRGIDEAYGGVSGPDRTEAQVEALEETFRQAAAKALVALHAYHGQVSDLPMPTLGEYAVALEVRRSERGPLAAPEPEARTPTPRVRQPLEGEDTFVRARTALGLAFGKLAAAYLAARVTEGKYAGMVAMGDLAGVTPRLGIVADTLARRRADADADIAGVVMGAADATEALYGEFDTELEASGDLTPEALEPLLGKVLECARDVGRRVRRVEEIAAARGYAAAVAHEGTAPSA